MKKTTVGKTPDYQVEIARLETYLQEALRPVQPRADYVRSVQSRLAKPGPAAGPRPDLLRYALFALVGIFSSVLIVIIGVRATIALLGSLGLLRHVETQVPQEPPTALTPAIEQAPV